jgi:hypothetical protein
MCTHAVLGGIERNAVLADAKKWCFLKMVAELNG